LIQSSRMIQRQRFGTLPVLIYEFHHSASYPRSLARP
jgi:hypothetical protein